MKKIDKKKCETKFIYFLIFNVKKKNYSTLESNIYNIHKQCCQRKKILKIEKKF